MMVMIHSHGVGVGVGVVMDDGLPFVLFLGPFAEKSEVGTQCCHGHPIHEHHDDHEDAYVNS